MEDFGTGEDQSLIIVSTVSAAAEAVKISDLSQIFSEGAYSFLEGNKTELKLITVLRNLRKIEPLLDEKEDFPASYKCLYKYLLDIKQNGKFEELEYQYFKQKDCIEIAFWYVNETGEMKFENLNPKGDESKIHYKHEGSIPNDRSYSLAVINRDLRGDKVSDKLVIIERNETGGVVITKKEPWNFWTYQEEVRTETEIVIAFSFKGIRLS